MPNTTVRAAAEGMSEVNQRRRFLGLSVGCLALAATAAVACDASAEPVAVTKRAKMSPELRAVIKAHKQALAYWLTVCGCTDSQKLGREATPEEEQTWDEGNDGEYTALWNVCRFPARTPADLAAKGRYLRKYHSWRFGYLDEDQVQALMLSMVEAGKGGAA